MSIHCCFFLTHDQLIWIYKTCCWNLLVGRSQCVIWDMVHFEYCVDDLDYKHIDAYNLKYVGITLIWFFDDTFFKYLYLLISTCSCQFTLKHTLINCVSPLSDPLPVLCWVLFFALTSKTLCCTNYLCDLKETETQCDIFPPHQMCDLPFRASFALTVCLPPAKVVSKVTIARI